MEQEESMFELKLIFTYELHVMNGSCVGLVKQSDTLMIMIIKKSLMEIKPMHIGVNHIET